MAKVREEENLIDEIETVLRSLDLQDSYKLKSADPESAHSKVIKEFNDFWFNKYPYFEKYSLQDIDFVGKKGQPESYILVAMEVDVGWWAALRNCVKLTNIRAENKIWIHITDSEDAIEDFRKALDEIEKLLKIRGETGESFGNFVAFLKTPEPEDFRVVHLFLHGARAN